MFSHKNAAISAWLSLMIGINRYPANLRSDTDCPEPSLACIITDSDPTIKQFLKNKKLFPHVRLTFALSCVYDNSHRNANFSFLCVTPAGFRKYFIK